MFDKNLFLGGTTTEQGSTEYTPIPENENGYPAVISKVDVRQEAGKDGTLMTLLDVTWDLSDNDGSIEAATGLKKNTVRQGFFLDITADGRGLDMGKGKNVPLNKLRDALGQNVAGQAWAPNMMMGKFAIVKIKQTMSEKGDGRIYSNVGSVVKG